MTSVTRGCLGTLACVSIFAATTGAAANSIYRPLGLHPGDAYRLVFVTKGTRDALSSDIADYNAFVTAGAKAPTSVVRGLAADWFAIGSTADADAIENTGTDPSPLGQTGVPIYFVDGETRFADHYDNLWDGDSFGQPYLGHNMLTQDGVVPDDQINNVWTGTDYYGIAGGIGGPLGSPAPSLGGSNGFNGRWINNNFRSLASREMSLYGISSVLVAVPEPSAATWLTASLVAFLSRRRWSRSRSLFLATTSGPGS